MTLTGLGRALAVAMVLVSAPLMILFGLEVYGVKLDPAVELWLMVVRGWSMGLVLTGSLALLPELWLRLRESAHRLVVGLIYVAGLAVHVAIGTPVLASKLVGSGLKETLTTGWLGENWLAFSWVGLSIFGFDLMLLGLVLSVGLLRVSEGPGETLGEYEGSPETLEAEAREALREASEGLSKASETLGGSAEGLLRVYEARCPECLKVFTSEVSQAEADQRLAGHKSWHSRQGMRNNETLEVGS